MENSSTQEIISLPISHVRSPDNDLAFVNAIKTYETCLPGGESQEEMR